MKVGYSSTYSMNSPPLFCFQIQYCPRLILTVWVSFRPSQSQPDMQAMLDNVRLCSPRRKNEALEYADTHRILPMVLMSCTLDWFRESPACTSHGCFKLQPKQHFSFTAFQLYNISACTSHGCFKLQPKQLFSFTQSRWIRRQKPRPPGVKTRFTFLPKSSKLLKVSATIWINVPRLPGWKR